MDERVDVPSAPHDADRRYSVHARLVLAPAGCWSAGLVLDIASRFSAEPDALVRIATGLTGLGLVGAVVAGVAGMVEAAPVPDGSAAHRRMLVHLGVALTVTVLVAFGLIVRSAVQDGGPAAPATLATSAIGVLLLVATAATGRAVRRARGRRGAPPPDVGDRPEPGP
ncbi:DUF2231 domain-containing protein [Pseudonocardia sp. KRD-182]|uniref:DUF2231 domain-containing protein n=1 Tax=Pseudonocardia oceani TaxID=2792013 RepID=UPI001C49F57F|nr:DUF2231 domain-containing protein [Pseudonocardia oceani]MBW0108843.1 DUF2231 domain-containing protein [Pseudonocardia oceani]